MRMTSDLSKMADITPLDKGIYKLRVKEKEDTKSKETNNNMVVLTWEPTEPLPGEDPKSILGPDDKPKTIRYDNIVLGGKNKKGEEINPFRLCNFLDVTGTPWGCEVCNNGESPRHFLVGKGEADGLVKGKYYCPDCKSDKLRISYDTDTFQGAQCKGVVNTKKSETSDKEFNVIDKYLPL